MPKPRASVRLACAACSRNLADVTAPRHYDRGPCSPVDEVVPRPGVAAPEVTFEPADHMFGVAGIASRYRFACRCGATPVIRRDRLEQAATEALIDGIPRRPHSIAI